MTCPKDALLVFRQEAYLVSYKGSANVLIFSKIGSDLFIYVLFFFGFWG